jgi:sugar lactone lactonase YvrE
MVFPPPQQVSAPASLTLDMQRQRYYVIDSQGGRLLSFDAEGTPLGEFSASGELIKPSAMTFGRAGKMWLIERAHNSLFHLDMETQQTREFFPLDKDGKRLFPDQVATDAAHNLYTNDSLSGRVYALDDNLKIAKVFAPQTGEHLIDFKIKGNKLWALERNKQAVYCFDLKDQKQQLIKLDRVLDFPVSLEIDAKNQLYILDRAAAKIYHFSGSGKYLDDFGQQGYRRGQLNYPAQLWFDWQQRLCVVNQGNDRIEIYTHPKK